MKKRINNLKNLRALAAIVLVVGLARSGVAGPSPFTLLHTFTGSDGNSPVGGLFWLGDGNFYGTTTMGGANDEPSGDGTIFSFSPLDDEFNSVYQFAEDVGGFKPYAGLTGFNGQLLGVSYNGGTPAISGRGAVFLAYQSGLTSWGLGNWHDFTGNLDGANPEGSLMQGSDGYYYGTTAAGGTNNYDRGVVFQLDPTNFTLTTLYSFTGGADGHHPIGALVEGNDGRFYGVTRFGGSNELGTVFSIGRVTAGIFHFWSLTTLHLFTGGADGGFPNGGLVLGTDGLFYGTTDYGGTNASPTLSGGGGTVYKIDSLGNLTPLHSFGDDSPQPLVQGTDGNFYGTTANGSSTKPYGTVFQISSSGTFNTLWTFSGTNGSNPAGALIQWGDAGNLYGTTSQGGSNNFGTIFSLNVPSLGPVTNLPVSRFRMRANHAALSILTAAGINYQLQSVDSLVQASWDNVGSPIQSGGGLLTLTDPKSALKNQRFYRVKFAFPAGMALIPAGAFTKGDTLDGETDATPR